MKEEKHLLNLLIEIADRQADQLLRTAAERLHRQKTSDGKKFLLGTVSLSQWHGLITEAARSQTVRGILAYLDSDKAPPWTETKGKEITNALLREIAMMRKQAEGEASRMLEKVRSVVGEEKNLFSAEQITDDLLWRWTFHYLSLVTRLKRGGA